MAEGRMVGIVRGDSIESGDGRSFRIEVGGKHDRRKLNGMEVEFVIAPSNVKSKVGGGVSLAKIMKVLGPSAAKKR